MDKWTTFAYLSIAAFVVGVSFAFFAGKFPSRGWVAIILLLSAALAWMRIEAGEGSSLPMFMVFSIIAPLPWFIRFE